MPKPTTGKFRAQEEREDPKIFREKMQATNKEFQNSSSRIEKKVE